MANFAECSMGLFRGDAWRPGNNEKTPADCAGGIRQ